MPASGSERPEVRLFGGIRALVAGDEIDLGGPKQRLVFATLVLARGRAISVSRMIESVWGDRPPDRAQASVRGYVSNLRRSLPPRCDVEIRWRDLGYVLIGDLDIDLDRFEDLVRSGRTAVAERRHRDGIADLESALRLGSGPPLGEFAELAPADDLVVRWEGLRGEAIELLFEARLGLGGHREATADLQSAVRDHPYRERLRALLATALYRSDRAVDALRSIDAARRQLIDEVGVEPGPALRSLEAMILAEDPALDLAEPHLRPSVPPVHGDALTRTELFVGRTAELARLVASLGASGTDASGGRVLVVSGEPGIGKSALLEQLGGVARDAGFLVTHVRCAESATAAPYWPWRLVAGSIATSTTPSIPDVGRELVELLDAGVDVDRPLGDPTATRLVTQLGVVEALRRLPARHLVVIDDLQWADGASLGLLEVLVSQLDRLPLVLAVSVRLDAATHPRVADCLAQMVRSRGSHRLELDPLGESDIADWVASTIGGRAAPDLASIVHARTGGNPFLVREVLALLTATDERTDLDLAAAALPAAVHDVVRRRTSHLDADTQRLLVTAAILGHDVDLDILSTITGRSVGQVLDLLEPAAQDRLVDLDPARPGRARFAHGLIADALAAELNPVRRARVHAEITEALEHKWAGSLDQVLPQLAFHAHAGASAGTAAVSVEYSVRASRAASLSGSPADAADHLSRALAAMAVAAPGDARRRLEILTELGVAQCAAGDVVAGRATLRDAAIMADALGDRPGLVRALSYVNADDLWTSLDWGQRDDEVIRLIERTLDLVGDDRRSRASLLAALAGQTYHVDPARSSRAAASAVEAAADVGDPDVLIRVLLQRYWAEWRPNGNAARTALADHMLQLLPSLQRATQFVPLAHLARFTTAYELGDASAVEQHLGLARASADPARTPAAWSYVLYGQVSLELLRGQLDRAADTIEQLHEALLRSRRFVADTTRAGLQMQLFVERGETDRALAELGRLESSIYAKPIAWFRAWVLAEGGRVGEAAEALDAYDGPVGDDWLTTPLLTAAVSAAAAVGHDEFLRRHIDSLLPTSAMLACTGSGGIVIGPVSLALARASFRLGRHAEAAAYLASARDMIGRMRATPWAARAA